MALYANTNMDMPENKRTERVKELEEAYDSVIDSIYGINPIEQEGEMSGEVAEQQAAFMKAAQRGQARILPPVMPGEETIGNLPE